MIGNLFFLKNWIIRSEISNALGKLIIRNPKTDEEKELKFVDEKVIVPSVSFKQRDRNTDEVYLSYSSPKTPGKTFIYNLKSNYKKGYFLKPYYHTAWVLNGLNSINFSFC